MKVLITGGSGFIAKHITRQCIDRDINVILQTRDKKLLDSYITHPKIKVINKSFVDLKAHELSNVESIIHLASVGVSPQIATWKELGEINIAGSLHICELAKSIGASLLVAGSFAEYGESGLDYEFIPVDAPLKPTYPYAISKAIACNLILQYAKYENLKVAYLRIFNAYGDGQYEKNLWPSLVSAASLGKDFQMSPGNQIRDFIKVEDVANQFISIAVSDKLISGRPLVVNCASGNPQTVKDFCIENWNKFSKGGNLDIGSLSYRDNEVMRFIPSMEPKYL